MSIRLQKKQRRRPAKQNPLELHHCLLQRQHQRSLERQRLLEEVLPRLYSVEPPHLQGEDSRRREIRPVAEELLPVQHLREEQLLARLPRRVELVLVGRAKQHHGLELLPAGAVGLLRQLPAGERQLGQVVVRVCREVGVAVPPLQHVSRLLSVDKHRQLSLQLRQLLRQRRTPATLASRRPNLCLQLRVQRKTP